MFTEAYIMTTLLLYTTLLLQHRAAAVEFDLGLHAL